MSTTGVQGDATSGEPTISADGRYVAFSSSASNLVASDTNAVGDIFMRDLQTGTTSRVSIATAGTQANGASLHASINGDGRYIAFDSAATNLVVGDTNAAQDVFVRDAQAGTTTRVSVPSGGEAPEGITLAGSGSSHPSISAYGGSVAFESTDSTFVFGDTNGASDIFVTGVQAGEPLRVSLSASGTQGNAGSFAPSIRGDGAAIAFASDATNLVTGDTNAVRDVFVGPPLQPQVSSYGYDRLYRLTSASGPDGSRTYTYDPAGNRATIASGGTSTYGYDRADRISSITGPPAAGTSTRSPSSNDAGWASGGNAYASDNAYATSAPAKNTTTAIKVGAFGFDATVPANAAITSVTVTVEWKVSTTASIATLGAQAWVNGVAVGSEFVNSAEPMADLSQPFTVSGLTRAQLLDGVFQVRVRATRGNSNNVFTASLDAVSVRVNYTTPNIVTLTSDANGNTTAKGADTFTYDQPNRLKTATVAGATETYTYDGDGVRFSRQVDANPAIRYVSDVNTSLPVTLDDGTRKYVWGLGLAFGVSGSTVEIYHADRLGSVRAISDGTGGISATYRNDEWGVPTASTGGTGQPFRYTGQPLDATGLIFLRARYYDPSLGRFISRDPIEYRGVSVTRINAYSYAADRPCTLTDPSGRTPSSQVLDGDESDYNVGECLAGIVGTYGLAEAGLLLFGGGVLLQGFSVTLFGVTFGGATPVSAGTFAGGLILEGAALTTEAAAIGLIYKTCVNQ